MFYLIKLNNNNNNNCYKTKNLTPFYLILLKYENNKNNYNTFLTHAVLF